MSSICVKNVLINFMNSGCSEWGFHFMLHKRIQELQVLVKYTDDMINVQCAGRHCIFFLYYHQLQFISFISISMGNGGEEGREYNILYSVGGRWHWSWKIYCSPKQFKCYVAGCPYSIFKIARRYCRGSGPELEFGGR